MEIKLIFLISIFLFAGIGFVIAENDDNAPDLTLEINGSAKNMTFGLCVSEAAKIRQDCYMQNKNLSVDCVKNAKVNKDKQQAKQCVLDFKIEKKNCKDSFKGAKRVCIQNYKPKFWGRIRYAFK